MKLRDLIQGTGAASSLPAQAGDIAITGLCLNSADAKPGFLFAALQGVKTHGIQFLNDAVSRGASVILTDADGARAAQSANLPVIVTANPRRDLALMAAKFYTPMPSVIAAITGTNGKTSGTVFTRQIWQKLGHRAASIGTIGIITPDWQKDSSLTTPDSISFHQLLQTLARERVTHAAFEAGSHGLHQDRIAGVPVDVAAFTNLTRDHLDYHGTMENYFAAKLILFSQLLKSGGAAVVNRDIEPFDTVNDVCRKRGARMISFGNGENADIQIAALEPKHDHQIVTFVIFGKTHKIKLPLIGAFQAANIACAIGMAHGSGDAIDAILPCLETLNGVPGRMQLVAKSPTGAPVFVDYAHTPDAIDNVLRSLRPHAKDRLIIAFGCGGDRDPGKRPMMGKIAADLADHVIVTDDNPRTEDSSKIRAQILTACPGADEIGDRAQAIAAGIGMLQPGDIFVIAGKGHEHGQIVGKTVLPFDDADVARNAARHLGGSVAA